MANYDVNKKKWKIKELERKENVRQSYYDEYLNIALSMFKWKFKGLSPFQNKMISDTLERYLTTQGMATIFVDPRDGVLKCYLVGGDITWNYATYYIGWSGVSESGSDTVSGLNIDNAVLIFNNKTKKPTTAYINYVIDTLVNIDNTIQQQLNAHKTPFVFSGKEEEMKSFGIFINELTDGLNAMYMDGRAPTGKPDDGFKVWNSDIDFKIDKLLDVEDKYDSKLLRRMGLQASYIEKKAQLNSEEVNKNDDIVLANFESYKSEREYAVELIKDILGIEVELIVNENLDLQNRKNKEPNKVEKEKQDE